MADNAPIAAAPNAQPYVGLVETTVQALRLAYAAHQGVIPRIVRRLNDAERREMIKSGAVFVFSVDESQIRRWTDSRLWSPSRIVGNFLVYREVYERVGTRNQRNTSSSPVDRTSSRGQWSNEQDEFQDGGYGAGAPNYDAVKPDGLLKKTITVTIGPSDLHVVSYYTQEDIRMNTLPKLSSRQDILGLELDPSVFRFSSFRNPPKVETGRNGQLRIVCEPEDNTVAEPPRPRQHRPSYNGSSYDPNSERTDLSLSPPIRSRSRFGNHFESTDPPAQGSGGRWRSSSDAPHPHSPAHSPTSSSAWPTTSPRQRSSTGDYFQSNSANSGPPLSASSSSSSMSPPWTPPGQNSSSRYPSNSTINPPPTGYWSYPPPQPRGAPRLQSGVSSYQNTDSSPTLYTMDNEYPSGGESQWPQGSARQSGPPVQLPAINSSGEHHYSPTTQSPTSSRYPRQEAYSSYGQS